MPAVVYGAPRITGTDTDGNAVVAQFYTPTGVAVDSSGNVYVADENSHRIRKITPEGVVSTLADSGGIAVGFSWPTGVAVDSSGNLYVADKDNHRIRKITSGGGVTIPLPEEVKKRVIRTPPAQWRGLMDPPAWPWIHPAFSMW